MDASAAQPAPRARPGSGRLRLLAIAVVALALVAVAAWIVEQPGATPASDGTGSGYTSRIGEVPPEFTATAVDGSSFSLAALKGQPVWLTIGASWCADCRAEALDLQAAYAKYQPQGLVLVSVFDREDATAVTDYAKRVGFTFTMVPNPDGSIRNLYEAYGIPVHLFIGRDGRIRDVRVGRLTRADMDQLVANLVNG